LNHTPIRCKSRRTGLRCSAGDLLERIADVEEFELTARPSPQSTACRAGAKQMVPPERTARLLVPQWGRPPRSDRPFGLAVTAVARSVRLRARHRVPGR